jgi:hypothetical protein
MKYATGFSRQNSYAGHNSPEPHVTTIVHLDHRRIHPSIHHDQLTVSGLQG